ncbi:hypothetical protein B0H14DRAFT_2579255 [Mycena olivaceomarginata]|nr:hypothetical protein B0H14DRAFT_2579255 [Mycena olivaceomarginata]
MSDGTKKGWGGSCVNSGRKKKAVVASLAPALPSTAPVDWSSTVAQLNKDLAALALDHPLDTSERIFDESLGDEDDEGDDSENAELAQKETEEAEPKTPMAGSKCRAATKTGSSGCALGTLFLLSNVPLPMASPQQVSISSQYLSGYRTFCRGAQTHSSVNVVQVLFSTDTMKTPSHGGITSCSQTATCAPLRRGNDKGCGKSYQGSDPWIIWQLPEFVQRAFPVCLSACGALDTGEMDVMKATFAGHFGADPFSKMVRELKVLHHDRLETMYYCAALHFGLRGPQQVPQFSKFDDSLGYTGYAPSRQYFKSLFTAWFSVHRTLIDRVMSSLSATIIKADHTYKVF